MLFSQLIELSQKVFSCQHPAPRDRVGAALPEAAQAAAAHQRVPHFPTWSSSKMPTPRLPPETDWVAWGTASAWAGCAGVCMSSTAAAACWPMGLGALSGGPRQASRLSLKGEGSSQHLLWRQLWLSPCLSCHDWELMLFHYQMSNNTVTGIIQSVALSSYPASITIFDVLL